MPKIVAGIRFADGTEIIPTQESYAARSAPSLRFRHSSVKMYFLVHVIALAICTGIVVHMYRLWRASTTNFLGKLAICISVVGVLGFFEVAWIDLLPPELLDRFELPNTLQAVRLTAPDGRVFIVSPAIARVQRYGPEGFEKGFMYGHKAFRFWMSVSGNVVICAANGELLTYSPDGAEVPPRGSCRGRFEVSSPSYPSHARVPTIAFNWFSALAVPLWHPVAGWVIILFGGLLFKLSTTPKSDTP